MSLSPEQDISAGPPETGACIFFVRGERKPVPDASVYMLVPRRDMQKEDKQT